jgi:hypothetical protein
MEVEVVVEVVAELTSHQVTIHQVMGNMAPAAAAAALSLALEDQEDQAVNLPVSQDNPVLIVPAVAAAAARTLVVPVVVEGQLARGPTTCAAQAAPLDLRSLVRKQ